MTDNYTFIERGNLTAEQILGLLDRWSSENAEVKAKYMKMRDKRLITRLQDDRLVVLFGTGDYDEAHTKEAIKKIWYATNEV